MMALEFDIGQKIAALQAQQKRLSTRVKSMEDSFSLITESMKKREDGLENNSGTLKDVFEVIQLHHGWFRLLHEKGQLDVQETDPETFSPACPHLKTPEEEAADEGS